MKHSIRFTFAGLTRLFRCQDGGILIVWAVLTPVIAGMMGLGLETGMWYVQKRNLQSAVDAAAITAAYETTQPNRISSAQSAVVSNGFSAGSNVTVTVNNPPASGSYTANSNAVEVILTQPQTMLFSSLFLSTKPTIKVRAVGLQTPVNTGGVCIAALDPSGSSDISSNGGATINAPNCIVASNSNNSTALTMNGGAKLTVNTLYMMGNYKMNGGATLTTTNAPTVNASTPVADPYLNVPIPAIGACNQNNYSLNGGAKAVLNPGVYCNGFSINGGAQATLNPGVYIIDRGSFSINGGTTLSGNGVTIILTSSTGNNYATASINGGANVTLSAPTNGTYSGLAFYQDRSAPDNTASSFNGGSTMNITGALYFPTGALSFNGGNSLNNPSCTQIIGWTLSFNGGSNVTGNCLNSGMTQISIPSAGPVSLVE